MTGSPDRSCRAVLRPRPRAERVQHVYLTDPDPGGRWGSAARRPVEGRRPIDILAAGTPQDVTLQLDVGTCMAAGADPVAFIHAHPGRITSLHLKDWAPGSPADERGYRVLFGEGVSPWPRIFEAAEARGGVEYYLLEQEGSRFPELETAERCLAAYRAMRG